MNRVCAAGMALLAFSCSLVIGLCVGNPFVTVVGRALVVMAIFYVLGLLFGVIGEKVIKENFDVEAEMIRQKTHAADAAAANPKPEAAAAAEASTAATSATTATTAKATAPGSPVNN